MIILLFLVPYVVSYHRRWFASIKSLSCIQLGFLPKSYVSMTLTKAALAKGSSIIFFYGEILCMVLRLFYAPLSLVNNFGRMIIYIKCCVIKGVQEGKDQEKAQSEKDSHSKNRGGKKPNQQSGTLYHETYRKLNEQLFSQ